MSKYNTGKYRENKIPYKQLYIFYNVDTPLASKR